MPIFWWGLHPHPPHVQHADITPVSGRVDLIKFYCQPVTGFLLIDSLLSGKKGALLGRGASFDTADNCAGHGAARAIARMTRSAMLEVLEEDYVRTARAEGLSTRVVGMHALRNALIPVVTMIGVLLGFLLPGWPVLTETIFSWPGVGKWLIESIGRRDYPALQGGILLIAAMVIVVNVIVDMLYRFINPKIRHAK